MSVGQVAVYVSETVCVRRCLVPSAHFVCLGPCSVLVSKLLEIMPKVGPQPRFERAFGYASIGIPVGFFDFTMVKEHFNTEEGFALVSRFPLKTKPGVP